MDKMKAVFDAMTDPLVDFSSRKLMVDFKDANGRDKNIDVFVCHNQCTTDEMIVRTLKAQIEQQGYTLSCIVDWPRCLYLAPGVLEETVRELGMTVPRDKKAAFRRLGWHPVNESELLAYWNDKETD